MVIFKFFIFILLTKFLFFLLFIILNKKHDVCCEIFVHIINKLYFNFYKNRN